MEWWHVIPMVPLSPPMGQSPAWGAQHGLGYEVGQVAELGKLQAETACAECLGRRRGSAGRCGGLQEKEHRCALGASTRRCLLSPASSSLPLFSSLHTTLPGGFLHRPTRMVRPAVGVSLYSPAQLPLPPSQDCGIRAKGTIAGEGGGETLICITGLNSAASRNVTQQTTKSVCTPFRTM